MENISASKRFCTKNGTVSGISNDWNGPDRVLVLESQCGVDPAEWRKCSVMTDRGRLIGGKALHDLKVDPKQTTDVASQHPEVFVRLIGGQD